MSVPWSDDRIKDFWTEQARDHGTAQAASWSDTCVMDMEVREILNHLADGDCVLDVGCANGHSTLRFARDRQVDIVGVDYVADMIDAARRASVAVRSELRGAARFDIGDARALAFADNTFDKVVVIRVIINLGEWQSQQRGLHEVARVLRPGGTLILSEATLQGWQRLNLLRQEWGLPAIPMPQFNNYLDEEKVADTLAPTCELVRVSNYASSYYVGTRVLKPLLAKTTGREERVANPTCELNRWFSQLPAAGDYGTQKMFFFRKRCASG